MPNLPPKPCTKAGCTAYQSTKGRCDAHQPKHNWKHTKTRHERGYDSNWYKIRARVLKRDNHLCQCDDCKINGIYLPANEVDHIIPKSRGGTDDYTNLMAINTECHKKKTHKESKHYQMDNIII